MNLFRILLLWAGIFICTALLCIIGPFRAIQWWFYSPDDGPTLKW